MNVLYFDCPAGAAGDMLLAALLDAGAPEEAIRAALDGLGLPDWSLEVTETARAGLRARRAEVTLTASEPERSYRDVVGVLQAADLPAPVRDRAATIFETLGRAEAKIHGKALEDTHLHEVGATDALIDIVGVAAALEHFAPFSAHCSPLPAGSGAVEAAHGILPVPVPAVVEILPEAVLVPGGHGETVTPTGAAILAATCDSFGTFPAMTLTGAGYGAGAREHDYPNVVRILSGVETTPAAGAVVIEANIDDATPEVLAYCISRLLEAGAHDAWVTPILMKKGRAAHTVSALCSEEQVRLMMDLILLETTTLGLRVFHVDKEMLERDRVDVEVEGHPVRVKRGFIAGQPSTFSPEYEDAVAAARATDLPLKEIYARATAAARAKS